MKSGTSIVDILAKDLKKLFPNQKGFSRTNLFYMKKWFEFYSLNQIEFENMSLAFDKSTVVKEYKTELERVNKEKDLIAKKLGETIVEKEFLEGKLESLVSSKTRKIFVDTKHELSINKQCKLLHIAKSTLYYEPVKKFSSDADIKFLNLLNEIHSEFPYYGTRRLVTALENEGINVGRKLLKTAMEYIGIKALYPKHKTTQAYKEHYKYKYLLKEFKNDKNQVVIDTPNKVWSKSYIKQQLVGQSKR